MAFDVAVGHQHGCGAATLKAADMSVNIQMIRPDELAEDPIDSLARSYGTSRWSVVLCSVRPGRIMMRYRRTDVSENCALPLGKH